MDYTPPDKHTFTACRQTRLKLNNLWKGIQPQVGLEALDFQRDGSQQGESIQKAFQIVWLWTLSKNFKLTHWYCILTSKEIKSSNRKQCKGFTACLFVWLFVDLLRTKVALLLILLKWSLFELFLCKGDVSSLERPLTPGGNTKWGKFQNMSPSVVYSIHQINHNSTILPHVLTGLSWSAATQLGMHSSCLSPTIWNITNDTTL